MSDNQPIPVRLDHDYESGTTIEPSNATWGVVAHATPEEIADRVATGTAALIADWPKQASCQCGYAHWMRHGPTLDLPGWLAKPPVSEIAGHGPLSPYSLN